MPTAKVEPRRPGRPAGPARKEPHGQRHHKILPPIPKPAPPNAYTLVRQWEEAHYAGNRVLAARLLADLRELAERPAGKADQP